MEISELPEPHLSLRKKNYPFACKAFVWDIRRLLNIWHFPKQWRYSEKQADIVLTHMKLIIKQ